jgi:hypothetical protein
MRNYETKIYDYVDKKTGAHIVKATTMYAGKTISAFSKCDPRDTFDLKFGTDVALKRLDIKIAQKRQASMMAYAKFCKQNLEWIEIEKRRVKKAMEKAEVFAFDRKVEIKDLEAELAEMLNNI